MRTMCQNSSLRSSPAVESLETRCCPSASIGIRGQLLLIRGDAAANTVAIQDDGAGNVTASIDGKSVTGSNIHGIFVDTRGGDDSVSYTLANPLETREFFGIRTGGGADTVTLDFSKGIAAGGHLRLGVSSGGGADNVSANLGSIAAGASAKVNIETGDGDSTVNVGFTGWLDGGLSTRIKSGDGNNNLTANYDVNAGSTGSLRSKIEAGDGNNDLTMNITGAGAATLKALHAKIEAGTGTNTIVNTSNVVVETGESD